MSLALLIWVQKVAAAVGSDASEEWPMLAHDAARSGATPAVLQPPFERKWYRLFPEEGIQSGVQPVIARGLVFLGTLRGLLHAMDEQTGRDTWTYQTGGPILHAAAVTADRVVLGCADGKVHALRVSDGQVVWTFDTRSSVWNSPVIDEGTVFIGSRGGVLFALNTEDGRVRWQAELGAPILQSPAVDAKKGHLYVGAEDLRMRAFQLKTGEAIWTSEPLPGASFRGYHPVVAPDGSVLVTSAPVMGYDRFQNLLLEMVREVFGDFASWRHKPEENARLRAENFRLMENPETYPKQLDFLRRRLTAEPAFQTFFVLDPLTGKQRFVAPIVSSESMNGPGAPPVVTPDGRVIVKFQALLRSRYEHYSPFLNVGYLDTSTGHIQPLLDESRTYGWHDSLLLVHDEQSQLTVAGTLLMNTHQDNVNAVDLRTLQGYPQPLALNIHEPVPGEALSLTLNQIRGTEFSVGNEWLIRGTAVYGGGSVLDVPVAVAGDSYYYLPTHELNSGCALIAYRMQKGAPALKRVASPSTRPTEAEWNQIQTSRWDWDSLATPRLTNLLQGLPGPVPGTLGAPLTEQADLTVQAIPDTELDRLIEKPAWNPDSALNTPAEFSALRDRLCQLTRELLDHSWRPLVLPAGKAPEEACVFFSDPSQTLYTLMLARPFLDAGVQEKADSHLSNWVANLPRAYPIRDGSLRTPYEVPYAHLKVAQESPLDDLSRLYPLWMWSETASGKGFVQEHWPELRPRLHAPLVAPDEDCGNARLAGLIAYCRMAKMVGDQGSLAEAQLLTRNAMRARLCYEHAYPRGALIRNLPGGRAALARWRHLTPDGARFLALYAKPVTDHLMATYVDYHRPGWWIAWNVEQLMRNEVAYQLPTTPLEIFTARALVQGESPRQLANFLDLPWCKADEYYLQKVALLLRAAGSLQSPKDARAASGAPKSPLHGSQ